MISELKNNPSVSIIIVNYNGKRLLKNCLTSLYNLEYPKESFKIKLIDNNSTDGSLEYVYRHFHRVEVLKNDENNYCKANNIGIKSSNSEYIALLNNDTAVDKNWLKALVDAIQQDQRIGCVGSKILFPDGRIQSTGHYEFPNFRWGDRGLREPDAGQYELSEEMNSLSGSAVLFRRDCLEDVGGFDEDFVMYLEDVDIFLRCRQKGWKLLYAPESIVYHKFHGTADEKVIRFYIERNRLLLVAKHFPKELYRALEGKEHSLSQEELFKILPDIFLKLIRNHPATLVETVLRDFFLSLQRLSNFSKDKAVQELNSILGEEKKRIAQFSKDTAKRSKELSEHINQLQEKIKQLEIERARLTEISNYKVTLETALNEKNRELENLKSQSTDMLRKLDSLQLESAHRSEILQEMEKQRNGLLTESHNRSEHINQLQEKIKQLEIEKQRISIEKESEKQEIKLELEKKVITLEQKIAEVQYKLQDRIQALVSLERIITEKNSQIEFMSQELKDKIRIIQEKVTFINRIFDSRTYRYLAIPLWRILDAIKLTFDLRIEEKRQKTVLVIKPFYVTAESTENSLKELRNIFQDAKIILLANVFKPDYDHLVNNKDVDEKVLYSPNYTKLTKVRLLKLLIRLNSRPLDEAIVLIDQPIYQGYRKGKLLAFLSGANSIKSYFVNTKTFSTLSLSIANSIKIIISWIKNTIVFYGLIIFFIIFIIMPIKIKKVFSR